MRNKKEREKNDAADGNEWKKEKFFFPGNFTNTFNTFQCVSKESWKKKYLGKHSFFFCFVWFGSLQYCRGCMYCSSLLFSSIQLFLVSCFHSVLERKRGEDGGKNNKPPNQPTLSPPLLLLEK